MTLLEFLVLKLNILTEAITTGHIKSFLKNGSVSIFKSILIELSAGIQVDINNGKVPPRKLSVKVETAETIDIGIVKVFLQDLVNFISKLESNAFVSNDETVNEFVRITKRKIRMTFKEYTTEFPLTAAILASPKV